VLSEKETVCHVIVAGILGICLLILFLMLKIGAFSEFDFDDQFLKRITNKTYENFVIKKN
jgi:hypothetical protein